MQIELNAHSRTIRGVEYVDFPIEVEVEAHEYPSDVGKVLEDVPLFVRVFGREWQVPFLKIFKEGEEIELLESEREKAVEDARDWILGIEEDAAVDRARDRDYFGD